MLSEPRSSLLLVTSCCQPRFESGSLNLLIMLTVGSDVLFPAVRNLRHQPGRQPTIDPPRAAMTSSISDSSARVAALGGRDADVATERRQTRSWSEVPTVR